MDSIIERNQHRARLGAWMISSNSGLVMPCSQIPPYRFVDAMAHDDSEDPEQHAGHREGADDVKAPLQHRR
ncbi:hypothetical protein [Nonomuraea angiospora]|uniref:hypothetical protein n=1 Tax=Nonomuraea angiospora TaxID=46172 RepID=UPI001CEF145A|nr:hypothetical protein [Nonomuraea angiospora]